jgi:hypothetical protein
MPINASKTIQRMRNSGLCLLGLVLVLAPGASAARHTAATRCRPGRTNLLAVDTHAEVYKVVNNTGPYWEVVGCADGGRPYVLGELPGNQLGPGAGGGLRHVTLTGVMSAYADYLFGEVGWARWLIVVRDLRTGQTLHMVPTGNLEEPNPNPYSAGIGPALAIVVKNDGSVAWVAEDFYLSENKPTYYQIHAVDKMGSRVVAEGTDIDPRSLALAGRTLYWTQNGQAMSAPLR